MASAIEIAKKISVMKTIGEKSAASKTEERNSEISVSGEKKKNEIKQRKYDGKGEKYREAKMAAKKEKRSMAKKWRKWRKKKMAIAKTKA
jgi:hypothetical protein